MLDKDKVKNIADLLIKLFLWLVDIADQNKKLWSGESFKWEFLQSCI